MRNLEVCLLDTNNLNNQEKHNYAKHKIPVSTNVMFVLSILEHANLFILLIEFLSQPQMSNFATDVPPNIKSTKTKVQHLW